MKSIFLCAILFASGLTCICAGNNPDKPVLPSLLPHVSEGEQIFLANAGECLAIIEKAANQIPMTGVAVVAFVPGEVSDTWISRMKVVGKLADEKVNLLGIAYTKAAEMAVTLKDSGNPDRKDMRGEYGYIGGVILKVKGGHILGSFSGGKGEDDAAAAREGLEWLAKKYD